MKSKFNYYWLLILFPLVFIFWFFLSGNKNKPAWQLPYFGPKRAIASKDSGYHQIPSFEFTDQYNEKVNSETIKDKIYVTEYFFTTCKSICPVMNTNLEKVYAEFKNEPDVLILSHTVDPETDSLEALAAYATLHGVNDKRWLFVTGEKKKLYELARNGYLLDAGNSEQNITEDFIHTQNFALVDKEQHIRGYYDGTDSLEVNRLIVEIKLLLKEYASKKDLVN